MANPNEDAGVAALSSGFDRQIDAMNALRVCLEDEYRALQARDPQQLLSAIEQKNHSIATATEIEHGCRHLMTADAMRAEGIVRKREKLDTLTRLCRDLNEANGSLIRRQRLRIETALRILRGAPEPAEVVYGPSGENGRKGVAGTLLASV